uniref:Uncharacterized protein n=1 Tax=Anguilla anguilla TaxID=7936 RepID=A0A0E9STR0_ANGAN
MGLKPKTFTFKSHTGLRTVVSLSKATSPQ